VGGIAAGLRRRSCAGVRGGPFIYFGMVTNQAAEDAWSLAVSTAKSMDLVCFDPQSGALAD
jgi:hypothetical protein